MNGWWPKIITPPPTTSWSSKFERRALVDVREWMARSHGGDIPRPAEEILALFIWLIIRFIRLVFSVETVCFSHKKSATSVFQLAYNSNRTGLLTLPSKML
jgi:hypothetical protein